MGPVIVLALGLALIYLGITGRIEAVWQALKDSSEK